MNKLLDCNIIQDLLPNYIEKLTSASTNESLEEHIKNCEQCKTILSDLQKNLENSHPVEVEQINFLKKINRRHTLLKICCSIFIVITLFFGIVKLSTVGFPAMVSTIEITNVRADEKNNDIFFNANATSTFFRPHSMKVLPLTDEPTVVYVSFERSLQNPFSGETEIPYGINEEIRAAFGYVEVNAIYMLDDSGGKKLIWEK